VTYQDLRFDPELRPIIILRLRLYGYPWTYRDRTYDYPDISDHPETYRDLFHYPTVILPRYLSH
jgi:hypothetical protein